MSSNKEYFDALFEILKSIGDDRIKSPHHVPVSVYIQEATTLYHRAEADREPLIESGLSLERIEDLPARAGALIEAEALWQVRKKEGNETAGLWAEESSTAYALRDRLFKSFRFAFRKHPGLLEILNHISRGDAHTDMIQDLNDLSVLGKKHPELLEAIKLDLSQLEDAARLSREMAALLARVNGSRLRQDENKRLRDQAYTYLKEAVDEIREYGRFVYRGDQGRLASYRSEYLWNKKKKAKARKAKKQEDTG